MVKPKSPISDPARRGPNFEKNKRPDSSKRVTYALGIEAQDQADRISRILSAYKERGISQSAVVRGLLQLAECVAHESGDPVANAVLKSSSIATAEKREKVGKNKEESALIWDRIRSVILES